MDRALAECSRLTLFNWFTYNSALLAGESYLHVLNLADLARRQKRLTLCSSFENSQGDLSNLEAISTFSLQNALQRAAELGILLRRRTPDSKRRLVALDPAWIDEDALGTWIERVGEFRREGKSRRTNALGECRELFILRFLAFRFNIRTDRLRLITAARRVLTLAKSLALTQVETTPWPLDSPNEFRDLPALLAKL